MISNLNITGLYYIYNYNLKDISYNDVHIITGPNGYGKTTILSIIYNLLNCNLWYFNFLIFNTIQVNFDDGTIIKLKKSTTNSSHIDTDTSSTLGNVKIVFVQKRKTELILISRAYITRIYYRLKALRTEYRTGKSDSIYEFLKNNYDYNVDTILPSNGKDIYIYLRGQGCSFLKSNRLEERDSIISLNNQENITNDIESVAEDMRLQYIANTNRYGIQCRMRDKSFISRLTDNHTNIDILDEVSYLRKAKMLSKEISEYQKYDIATDLSISLTYKKDYSVVMSLYLKDVEDKLSLLEDFYNRLYLFDSFISNKTLSHKHMSLSQRHGINFNDELGNPIPLKNLSDGEKSLIVLYYNLIFRNPGVSILLIDEPEKSMHVEWVSNMLEDYKKMAKELHCQIIFSTHSPTFINGNWDICTDLFELNGNK